MSAIDETHDAGAELGRFGPRRRRIPDSEPAVRESSARPAATPRGGVAIGDMIFDLGAGLDAGLFAGEARRRPRLLPGRRSTR